MEGIQGAVTDVLVSVALAVITLLGSYAVYYIKKASDKVKVEIEKLEDEEFENFISRALNRLSEVATLTVNKIEQQTAKILREAIKDGKASKTELEALSMDAYSEIIKVLEPEYVELLNDVLGDTKVYIMNLIEDKLVEVKDRDLVLSMRAETIGF